MDTASRIIRNKIATMRMKNNKDDGLLMESTATIIHNTLNPIYTQITVNIHRPVRLEIYRILFNTL